MSPSDCSHSRLGHSLGFGVEIRAASRISSQNLTSIRDARDDAREPSGHSPQRGKENCWRRRRVDSAAVAEPKGKGLPLPPAWVVRRMLG